MIDRALIPPESADDTVQAALAQFLELKTTAAAWLLGWSCMQAAQDIAAEENTPTLSPVTVLQHALDVARLEWSPPPDLDDELLFEQLVAAVLALFEDDE